MADPIVVLDSSDDDGDGFIVRKVSQISRSKKGLTTSRKTSSSSSSNDQRLSGTLLSSMQAVETLTTPTATPPLQLLASPPRNSSSTKEKAPSPIVDLDSPKSIEKTVKRVKLTTIIKETDDAWQQLRQKRQGSLASVQSPQQRSSPTTTSTTSPTATPTATPTSTPTSSSSEIAATDCSTMSETDLISTTPTKLADEEVNTDNGATEDLKEKQPPLEEKAPLGKEYEELLDECRKADPSPDMKRLIETKLLRYYYSVHPDFVKSRGFRKSVTSTTERIRAEPSLVYYNLKTVVDELNVRRKSKCVVVTNDESSTSASVAMNNKHTEEQIKKLNKALYILKKRITKLEEADVDWEDEDSSYLQVERFKKRACQIYEKICDLTGESKSARRIVKKPIQFSGTTYPSFNKTLQAYINRTKEFPDFFDVLRMLEHCNRQYDLKLASFEVKRIAQDAFIKVGKILQSRRKTDLYETVSHFTGNCTDPAADDPTLLAKLKDNEKYRSKINEVIEKYARVQDDPEALAELQKANKERNLRDHSEENGRLNSDKKKNFFNSDESDENDDDDDDENIDEHVDKLTRDNTVDMSDVDSDIEINDGDGGGGGADGGSEGGGGGGGGGKETTEIKTQHTNESKDGEKQDIQSREGVHVTENNNIMRTKTNESSVTIEDMNALGTNTITASEGTKKKNNEKPITALPEKTKSIDIVNVVRQSNIVASTRLQKTTANIKSTNPAKHRTIAEIVISDEE